MSTNQQFEIALKEVKKLSGLSNDDLLKLYSLFKQATDGDVAGSRPGIFDIKGRAKFNAWGKVKGMSKEEAMEHYIALVKKLKAK